jgi:outer membrane immunogenic protein
MRNPLSSVLFAGSLFAAFSAQAQDAAPVPAIDWSGFYIGAIGGGIAGDFEGESSGAVVPPLPGVPIEIPYGSFNFEDANGFAGGEIGINHQVGSFVFGVVADALGTDLEDSEPFGPIAIGTGTTLSGDVAAALGWLATVRGKAGVAAGPFFFYGTGGLAFGEIDAAVGANPTTIVIPGPGPIAASLLDPGDYLFYDDDEDLGVGFAVGAGAAFQFPAGFVVDLSYLYVNLGDTDFDFQFTPITIGNAHVDFDAHLGRAAIAYRF